MRIDLTEESHNHVDWEVRWPLLQMEIGLIVGLLGLLLVVIPSPSPARWIVAGVSSGVVVLLGVVLAAFSPIADRGHLERLPDGGDLRRTRAWPVVGERVALDTTLDDVAGFEIEEAPFDDGQPTPYRLARLSVIRSDGARQALTVWAQPASVVELEKALNRALRRDM